MKKRLNFKNGVSLISILIISAIAIILTVTVVKLITKGANVLSKAQSAKEESREATIKDAMAILIASYKTESIEIGMNKKSFKTYLEEKKQSTEIDNFWYNDKLIIIKYQSAYAVLKEEKKEIAILGSLPFNNDAEVENTMKYYTQSLEFEGEEKIKFENKNIYIISQDVKQNCYDYTIPENSEVLIAFIDDVEINNKDLEKPAIELENDSTLSLYVFSNVIINSRYNGNSEIIYNEIDSNFGYAGIHVPVKSDLEIYGTGTLSCYGGMAKKGGTYVEGEYTSGNGGGGAGAGIGGNGGNGGTQSKFSSLQGGIAGSCGTVRICSNVLVRAYGGAGAEGGDSTNTGAGAGGGYPAAGIGGGGAGGAGATEMVGAGGYSGGAGISNDENKISGGKNGLAGGHIEDLKKPEYYFAGGGYLEGSSGIDSKKVDRAKKCLGGFGGIGNEDTKISGNGGIGGTGGNVIIKGNAKVNAFNGNKITDGNQEPGVNPIEIYAQSGYSGEKYNYKSAENMKFTLSRYIKKKKVKTIDYGQGIGAGAGYIEGKNGKFKDYTQN